MQTPPPAIGDASRGDSGALFIATASSGLQPVLLAVPVGGLAEAFGEGALRGEAQVAADGLR
jgi:hypothetical protein